MCGIRPRRQWRSASPTNINTARTVDGMPDRTRDRFWHKPPDNKSAAIRSPRGHIAIVGYTPEALVARHKGLHTAAAHTRLGARIPAGVHNSAAAHRRAAVRHSPSAAGLHPQR